MGPDRSRCRVAESLGISDGSLAAWAAEFEARDAPGGLNESERAEHPITLLCGLVELPRATHCRWANSAVSDRLIDDAYLANEIVDIYRQSRGTYGAPRVWASSADAASRSQRTVGPG